MSGRSRSRSRHVSSTNDRSRSGRSKSRSRRSAASKSDKGRNCNRRRNASPVGPSFQTYFDDSLFQNYFDEAVKSATTAAIEIFEKRDDDNQFDDDTDFSDEFSFATPESTCSDRGGKSSAKNHSMKVAAVSTEAEKKTQPDIATFRLKKNGRPRVVRNLVKQLKRDEEKYQKAARALQEAEENMWKTKWRLYNLAEDFGLLCGLNVDANAVKKEKEENKMVVHDNVYNDDDYDDDSYAHSEYSYDR